MTAQEQAEAIRRAADLSVDHISAWFATGTDHSTFQAMREEIERNMTESLKFYVDSQSAFKDQRIEQLETRHESDGQRISELQKELHEFRTDMSGTIQQALDRLTTEKDRLIRMKEDEVGLLKQRIAELGDLLDRVSHLTRARTFQADASGFCALDCPACAWARMKEGK